MSWFSQLLQALGFVQNLLVQLAVFNSTPVGGTASITISPGHLLEVSEGGEHWEITAVTAVRVK